MGGLEAFKNRPSWGARLAQAAEPKTPDLRVVRWSPTLGVEITQQ